MIETMSWPALISHLLARRDLPATATAWVMDQVIQGDAAPAQLAALLVALRAKGETAAEVDGFVEALLRAATPVPIPGPTVDIAGTGGDGTHAVNLSTMAAIVVAATGARVVKHGGRAASATTAGSADLVERLGVPLDLDAAQHAAVAAEAGITFLFAARAHPGMRHAGPVRRELGVPTVFNVLGPLINPAAPTHRLIGVADARMLPVVVEVLRRRGGSGLVVRGDDGLDKISTATTSRVWTVHDGRATGEVVDPAALGIARPAPGALRGGDAATNARVAHDLLAGRPGPIRDAVLLNAAATLIATSPAGDNAATTLNTTSPAGDNAATTLNTTSPVADRLRPALDRCAEAVDSGAAAETLRRWIAASRAQHRFARIN